MSIDADIKRQIRREQFLSEEDLDLVNLSWEELIEYWNLWLEQAQISNDLVKDEYSHGVFYSPKETERLLKKYKR